MPERRDCAFCGNPIEPGTGRLFVRRDGTRHTFCSEKCQKNLLKLKRIPRTIKWTKAYVKGSAERGRGDARQTGRESDATAPVPEAKVKPPPKAKAAIASKK